MKTFGALAAVPVGLAFALISGPAAAQLVSAGTENGYRYAIHVEGSGPRGQVPRRVNLYEVPIAPARGEMYAFIPTDIDCEARERRDWGRIRYGSEWDPMSTVFSPRRVIPAESSPAVALQVAIMCDPNAEAEAERTSLVEMLRQTR